MDMMTILYRVAYLTGTRNKQMSWMETEGESQQDAIRILGERNSEEQKIL